MRPRLLLAVGAVVAVVAVAVVLVVRLGGPDGPTDGDRDLLASALSVVDATDAPAVVALEGVRSLSADPGRWGRLVAGGGTDLARLLDAAQPALGHDEPDPVAVAEPVVAPFVAGDAVDDHVVLALGRWTWPLLAADLSSSSAQQRAGAVLARAEEGDRDAVTAAVLLARLHRTLTGPADRAAVAAWRTDLARSAPADAADGEDLAGALRSGDLQDQPAALLRGVLAAWGPDEARATDAARAAIAADREGGLARSGSAITIASYLAVIEETDDTAAAEVVTRLASGADPLTEDSSSLVALEDALLHVDDPALAPATATATLLRTA